MYIVCVHQLPTSCTPPAHMQALIDQQVNTFSMRSGLTENDFGWGTPTFAKMGREKIRLIRVFLDLDVTVVISDVDVLWLRNPIPYFQSTCLCVCVR